jgi:hypothetical protein
MKTPDKPKKVFRYDEPKRLGGRKVPLQATHDKPFMNFFASLPDGAGGVRGPAVQLSTGSNSRSTQSEHQQNEAYGEGAGACNQSERMTSERCLTKVTQDLVHGEPVFLPHWFVIYQLDKGYISSEQAKAFVDGRIGTCNLCFQHPLGEMWVRVSNIKRCNDRHGHLVMVGRE